MNFNEYQLKAVSTAIYPKELKVIYPAIGLPGEVGEVCEKIKKVLRDGNGFFSESNKVELQKELGDVLWYIANIANDLELTLDDVAQGNIDKLSSRKMRNKLQGSGDNR